MGSKLKWILSQLFCVLCCPLDCLSILNMYIPTPSPPTRLFDPVSSSIRERKIDRERERERERESQFFISIYLTLLGSCLSDLLISFFLINSGTPSTFQKYINKTKKPLWSPAAISGSVSGVWLRLPPSVVVWRIYSPLKACVLGH